MRNIASIAILMLAASCTGADLVPGKYRFEVQAWKGEKSYINTASCEIIITDGALRIVAVGTEAHNAYFQGKQADGKIEFQIVFPENTVASAMKITNRYTGKVLSSEEAEGKLIGTAGGEVYLTGKWNLKKQPEDKESNQ